MNFGKRAFEAVRAKAAEKKANVAKADAELAKQGEQGSSARLPNEFARFIETVQPDEGFVYGEFYGIGHRTLRLSHSIYKGLLSGNRLTGGYRKLNFWGEMPRPEEALPAHLYNFQSRYAASRTAQVGIESLSIWENEIRIDYRDKQPDNISDSLYIMTARCLFDFDPDLEAVRLGASQWRQTEAARLAGRVIYRSMFEPPEDPAATT